METPQPLNLSTLKIGSLFYEVDLFWAKISKCRLYKSTTVKTHNRTTIEIVAIREFDGGKQAIDIDQKTPIFKTKKEAALYLERHTKDKLNERLLYWVNQKEEATRLLKSSNEKILELSDKLTKLKETHAPRT